MSDFYRQVNKKILVAAGGSAAVCELIGQGDPVAFEADFVARINFVNCMAGMADKSHPGDSKPTPLQVWHKLVNFCDNKDTKNQQKLEESLLQSAASLANVICEQRGSAKRKRGEDGEAYGVADAALVSLCYWALVFDRAKNKKGVVFRTRKRESSRILRAVRGVWTLPPIDGHAIKVTSAVGGCYGPKHTTLAAHAPGAWVVDTWAAMVETACTGPVCPIIQLLLLREKQEVGGGNPQPWHFEPGKEDGVVPLLLRHNIGDYLSHSDYANCSAAQKLADSLKVSCHTIDAEAKENVLTLETCEHVCEWASLKRGALVILVLQCVVETDSARWWMPKSDAVGRKHPDSLSLMQKVNRQLTSFGRERYRRII